MKGCRGRAVYRPTNKLIPTTLVLSGCTIATLSTLMIRRDPWDFLPMSMGGAAVEVVGAAWMCVAWEVDARRYHKAAGTIGPNQGIRP